MKKLICLFTLLTFFSFSSLHAEQKTVGAAAANASAAGKENQWQGWAVAGGMVVAATICLILVGIHQGSHHHSHS